MGRHAEWRKIAKKMRRKRIRSLIASRRDEILQKEQKERESSPRYQEWVKKQDVLERFRLAEEECQAKERQKQWVDEEKAASIRWQEQQIKLAKAKEEKTKQEMLIREEWDREQKKLQEAEEVKKKLEEAKKKKEEEILARIEAFISGQGRFPSEADISTETHPDRPICPFFSKTGACRFKDNCSRNHIRPGISRVLLIPHFYDHLSIQTLHQTEYDTDVGLEYEDSETYHHFLEFYNDVLPEFEACGQITQFKVCNNEEQHLRGNVYIEYSKERYAMKAYRKFQGRYYAGRQLSVEFCNIPSWRNAICGLYHIQKCPKGKTCNFLHAFWNPKKEVGSHRSSYHCRSLSRSPSYNSSRISEENWNWTDESSSSENESTRRSHNRGSKKQDEVRWGRKSRHMNDHKKRKRSRSPKRKKSKTKYTSTSSTASKSDKRDSNEVSENINNSSNKRKKSKTDKQLRYKEQNFGNLKDDNYIQR